MTRRVRLILVSLGVVILASLVLFSQGPGGPRLSFVAFTNAPHSQETAALLCLRNATGHPIYLDDPTNRVMFYIRETATPAGWEETAIPAVNRWVYTWELGPGQSFVFSVPPPTNQQKAWRVKVRYADGAVLTQIPILWRVLPGGGPQFRLPWKGSGRNYTLVTDELRTQP